MLAWIIYHRDNAVYNRQYINFYVEEGAKLGIEFRLLIVEEMEFGVREGHWFLTYQREEPARPDFVICRAIYPLLTRQLEYMGIPVFNNSVVSELCNDKARTYQYLATSGISMVNTSFYKNAQLEEVIHRAKAPTVIKAVAGHGGSQVFLVKGNNETDPTKASFVLERMSGCDAVVQPLTGTRNQDLRVYVIGKEIVASVLRTAKEGFKSNFSLGGEVSLYTLREEEKTIVNRIIDRFEFGLVGIDFIIGDEGELIFNEIEDVVGSRMLYQCSNINIVERYLTYIRSKLE
jgi:gamma-F420-2:alpha-L-glutamate ligase